MLVSCMLWLAAVATPSLSSQIVIERSVGLRPDSLRIDGPICDGTFNCSVYNAVPSDEICECVCPEHTNTFSSTQNECINAVNGCDGISLETNSSPNVFGFLRKNQPYITLHPAQLDVELDVPVSECTSTVLIEDRDDWAASSSHQARLILNDEDDSIDIQIITNMTSAEPSDLDGKLVELEFSCGDNSLCVVIKFQGISTVRISDSPKAPTIPLRSAPFKRDVIYVITGVCVGLLVVTTFTILLVYKCVKSLNQAKPDIKVERIDSNGNIIQPRQSSLFTKVQVNPSGKVNRPQCSKKIQGRFIKNTRENNVASAGHPKNIPQPQISRLPQSTLESNGSQRNSTSTTSQSRGMFVVNPYPMMKRQSHTNAAVRSKSFANGGKTPIHQFQRSKSMNECSKSERQGIASAVKSARSRLVEFEGILVKAEKDQVAINPATLFNLNRQKMGNYSGIIGEYHQPIPLKDMSETSGSQFSLDMNQFEKSSLKPQNKTQASSNRSTQNEGHQASSATDSDPSTDQGESDSTNQPITVSRRQSVPRDYITEDFYFTQPIDATTSSIIVENEKVNGRAPDTNNDTSGDSTADTHRLPLSSGANEYIPVISSPADRLESESPIPKSMISDVNSSPDYTQTSIEIYPEDECPITNIDDLMATESDPEEVVRINGDLPDIETVVITTRF